MASIPIDDNVAALLAADPVMLSEFMLCPDCMRHVRFVGEHQVHGNWYCPACGAWFERMSDAGQEMVVWLRAQTVRDTDSLFRE